ncbi:ABC transporter permease [Streptomyces radicis]|uniref:Autoinducer 2 import system permease protein LsrD n=1 Tax=Streptomyces radicis TaxID=1750517 RepID=A0A3A9WDU0_9ACTN|nr:ABC transporter permease [Streptomyces radicis]RKN10473.1 ABC transporter permease [Streptomyces radicis]RKN24732.1 ABC transporter permease [Streptomyces radicis]
MAHDSLYASPQRRPGAGRGRRRTAWVPRRWDAALVSALLLVVLGSALLVDGFATGRNAQFLLLDAVAIGLVALPMTLVVITGEIDLSVASTLGLCSAVMGQLWLSGWPLELVVVAAVALGAVLGAVNGVFVTAFGLPSLAVTIGTLAAYRGLAFVVLGDQAVADFPGDWTSAAVETAPGGALPWAMVGTALLAVAFGVVLHATPFGRELYAIGSNAEAARFSGIPVARRKFWLFVVCGAVSGLAGVYWTLRYASARADNGEGLELAVVAAVLLGGVSIFGGRGTLAGVCAGVLLLGVLRNALQLADVAADTLDIVTGSLLIVSVVVPNAVAMARARLARKDRHEGTHERKFG